MADVTRLILSDDQTDLLIEDDAQTIVAENEPEQINSVDIRTVVLLQNETVVVSVAEAGPQGAPGSSGTSDNVPPTTQTPTTDPSGGTSVVPTTEPSTDPTTDHAVPLRGLLESLGYSAYPWSLGFNFGTMTYVYVKHS